MKKQLVQVSVLQSAKVVAALYLVTAIPAALLVGLVTSLTNQAFSLFLLILLPLLYAFFGFVFSVVACWIYNLVASRIGGLEYTSAEVEAVSL